LIACGIVRAQWVGAQIQRLLLKQAHSRSSQLFAEPSRGKLSRIFVAFKPTGRQVGHDKLGIGPCAVSSALPIIRRGWLQLLAA